MFSLITKLFIFTRYDYMFKSFNHYNKTRFFFDIYRTYNKHKKLFPNDSYNSFEFCTTIQLCHLISEKNQLKNFRYYSDVHQKFSLCGSNIIRTYISFGCLRYTNVPDIHAKMS